MRRLLTFSKLVANAAASALFVPLLFLGLVLGLNPEVSPRVVDLLAAWAILALAYGPPILIALPLAFTCVRFFAARPLQIGWFHLKTTVWFLITGVGAAAALYAWNLALFGELLGARGRLRLKAEIAILGAAWLAALVLAGTAQWKEGAARERGLRLALGVLAAGAPLCLPALLISGAKAPAAPSTVPEITSRSGPVVLLAIEGASFSEILPLASEGRLPNLSRMLKEGSRGPLRTLRPCRSLNAWASLATGKLPARHGIKEANRYSLGTIPEELRLLPEGLFLRRWLPARWLASRPAGGKDLRARPLWTILDQLRVEAVFLDWPLAAGSRPQGLDEESEDRAMRSKEWLTRIGGGAALTIEEERRLVRAITSDLSVQETLLRILWSPARPRFLAAYLPGMGAIGSTFPHVAHAERAGDVPQEEVERYSRITDRYYEMLDQLVGRIRGALPAGGYLMIVSPYGTEALGAADRLARRLAGLPAAAGGHEGAPAGVLMLAGNGVAQGRQLDDLKITDAVPLTLYFLGLPVGRDMDGRLPRRLFGRDYLEASPITFIPTYG